MGVFCPILTPKKMYNITLICTRHKEIGACNSAELLRIIERYQPEVIFEELTPTAYDTYYTQNCWGVIDRTSLETDAIKAYQQNSDVKHIPALSVAMRDDFRLMRKRFANRSLDVMIDNYDLLIANHGFKFINSDEWELRLDELKAFEKSLLKDDDFYLKGYQCVDDYEHDMLRNIYQYSAENEYYTALMFIGAAHRKSIKQKIKGYQNQQALKLNWTFYNEVIS